MKKFIGFFVFAVVLGAVSIAFADVNAVTPSTNDLNKSKTPTMWAHVNQLSIGPGTTDLEFVSMRSFYSCFEYRTDGDTSQVIGTNYNPDITDGLYPYYCQNNDSRTETISANEYVEVRMVFGGETDERFDWTRFDVGPPAYSCDGFEPPMNMALLPPAMGGGPIGRRVKQNRVLPFKATLVDGDENPVTDLMSPPVIQVIYTDLLMSSADVTDDALTSGKRNEGNQFILAGDKWTFNLSTKLYSAQGSYTVTMESGNTDEYVIDPACEGIFVIE